MKVYLLGILLFAGWIVGLLYGVTGGFIHALPVLALFIIAFGQSKRKKIFSYVGALKARLPFVAKQTPVKKNATE